MTVSTVKKSHATIPAAWARRNVVHDSDDRPGAGSMPARLEDRPHGRRGDGDAEPGEFAVDAAVTPRRVLSSEADDQSDGSRPRWMAGRADAGRSSGSRRGVDANPGSCRASRGRSTSGHGRARERARRGSRGRRVRSADVRSGVAGPRADGATRGSRHPWNDPAGRAAPTGRSAGRRPHIHSPRSQPANPDPSPTNTQINSPDRISGTHRFPVAGGRTRKAGDPGTRSPAFPFLLRGWQVGGVLPSEGTEARALGSRVPAPMSPGGGRGAQPLPDKSATLADSFSPLPASNDGDQRHAISVSASIPRRRESAIQWKHAEAWRYVSPSWIQRSGPLQSMCYRQGPPG